MASAVLSISTATGQEAQQMERMAPYVFMENQGQILTADAFPATDVRYLFRSSGLNIILREHGFSYELVSRTTAALSTSENTDTPSQAYKTTRIDVDFEGAAGHPAIRSEDRSEYYENYYLAERVTADKFESKEFTHVPAFRKVIYEDVWPGISVEFLASQGQDEPAFKYNLIAEPGADISQARLRYTGAQARSLGDDLRLEYPTGHLDEVIPASWLLQDGRQRAVKAAYVQTPADPSVIGFTCEGGALARGLDRLVIDPTPIFYWGRYVGGNDTEEGYDVVVNTTNIYVCGYTFSAGLGTPGTQQPNITPNSTNSDAFLSKFDLSGAPVWTTYYGSATSETAKSVALDPQNNIFMVGMTDSNAGIAFGAGADGSYGGVQDAFVAKFTPAGLRTWCAYFGGPSQEQAYSAAAVGNDVFIAGNTYSSTQVAVGASVHQATRQGPQDGFVARLSGSNGAVLWASYYGGPGNETGGAVAGGPDGNAYLVGTTTSASLISTAGAWHAGLLGTNDGYLAKLNGTTGARFWGTYIGGNATDGVTEVAVNCAGDVYIVGKTTSSSGFAAPATVHQSAYGGGASDGIVARFTAGGVFSWATYYGGNDGDYLAGVTIGGDARVFVGGTTFTTTGTAIATPGSSNPSFLGGSTDGFLVSFTSGGVRNWGTYYGGEGNDDVYGVFQAGNRLYSTGRTYSNTIISTLNTEPGGPGLPDAFLGCHSADLATTCGGGSGMWQGNTTSGTTAEQSRSGIVPWPNPTGSWTTLQGAETTGLNTVEIRDGQGRLCRNMVGNELRTASDGGGVRLDLSSLRPGIYNVVLIYEDERRSGTRVIVQP